MSTELPTSPLTPEELALRQKNVRKWVLLRGVLLGAIIAAWWIFFAPEELVEPGWRNPLGYLAGLIASGSYFFNLRDALFPKSPKP
jgi:hypothetical protein